tara:strand:- start:2575 stop:2709 length:135 start_codon:yes stop_codon:yes gene_type:complete
MRDRYKAFAAYAEYRHTIHKESGATIRVVCGALGDAENRCGLLD